MQSKRQLTILAALFSAAFLFPLDRAVATDRGSSDAKLDSLMAEYWDFALEEDPLLATQAGVSDFNDRLPSVTPADNKRRLQTLRRFHGRTTDIDPDTLSDNGRINAELFAWVLEDAIGANELALSRIPFNTFSGFFMDVLTAANGIRMDDVDAYEDYLARLSDVPRYFDENIANMKLGVESGFVLPRVVIENVLPSIRAQVKDDPSDSSLYAPFENMSARVSEREKEKLREQARRVIAETVIPAFKRLGDFFANEYHASTALGAEALNNGKAYYAFQIQRYTTIRELTSDEIHKIGLAEVARIKAEMMEIIASLDFDGDFDAFAEFLRTDPQFYAQTPDQLLKEAAFMAKRIDYLMPGYFGAFPRQSYGIVPVPDEIAPNYTTGA